jgi:paired amphipathic helix protein Sin3a
MFDGEIDWQQFEEVARFMFGTKAYVVFTIEQLASRVIKQVGTFAFLNVITGN